MALSKRDSAEAGGFLIGLGMGVFLAFMPILIERKTLSLTESRAIAGLLTLAALVAFVISKRESIKEERERAQRDKDRDELIQRIFLNQAKERRSRGQAGPEIEAAEIAANFYGVLVKNEGVNVFIVGDETVNKMIGAAEDFNSKYLRSEEIRKQIERAKPKLSKKRPRVMAFMAPVTRADDLRSLADSLARAATLEKPAG